MICALVRRAIFHGEIRPSIQQPKTEAISDGKKVATALV
jgi:hypothetical protein